jgi:hypothetical protein
MGSLAVARLEELSQRFGIGIEIRITEVESEFDMPVGYMGSPTILVAGVDIDPAVRDLESTGAG